MKDEEGLARAHAIFDPIADDYLTRPEVDIGPMFGSEGLRVRGKIFAFLDFRGGLVVKVPQSRADEIVAEGVAARMVMREREMREWLSVARADHEQWAPLIAEAFAYVDEITP
ncbi:TfoX/Sxy family protein [Microbacterium rhizomatis]|uniref:TfoX/Sxy family protein n=1 Tax=Microbacterium rhizomatis TaxID=1631477 RepID=A0A5J5IXM6_9MICO|nr:TfoX/Sxy family protein [Microbacterium rhizomatis]KAA9106412.1 TfoX/Sxy family protein [Microbacterium rhizomatis]